MERLKRKGISLCVPADEKKVANFGQNFYIQPKLNGERAVTDSFHEMPLLLSSYENTFEFLDHIRGPIAAIWEAFKTPIPFDGEIYKHGWSREQIDSALRRTVNYNPEVMELEYHIFDLKLPLPQNQRLYMLDQVFLTINENPQCAAVLKQVPTFKATKFTWLEFADKFLELGYEGAVLRNAHYGEYYAGRTVKQMLKYKPTEIDEYLIVGVEEAISQEGVPKGMVGSFIVRAHDGEDTFKVGAGKLTHKQRTYYWDHINFYIGSTLVTKQGKILTTNRIPTCAVAVEVKEN